MRHNDPLRWQQAGLRYIDALDAGDLDQLALLWRQAVTQPQLEQLLCELSQGLLEEDPSNPWRQLADRVRDGLGRYLPSGRPSEQLSAAITAGDVAGRIAGDNALLRRLHADDRNANAALLSCRVPLPSDLGAGALESWMASLPAATSPGYRRVFRQAAVLLAMSRGEHAASLSAARPGATRRPGPGRSHPPSQDGRQA